MTVLLSESLSHSFKQFVQTADSIAGNGKNADLQIETWLSKERLLSNSTQVSN